MWTKCFRQQYCVYFICKLLPKTQGPFQKQLSFPTKLPSGKLTSRWKMAIYSEFTHEKRWFSVVMWQFTRPGTLKNRKRPVKKGRSSKADDAGYLWGLLHFHRPHVFRNLTRSHVSMSWSSNDTWKKCPTLESLSYKKKKQFYNLQYHQYHLSLWYSYIHL